MKQFLLVLFAIISQNEILELNLHLDPLLVSESGPNVMGLSDCCLVGFQDHFGAVIIYVERSEDQNKSGEGLEMEQTSQNVI